MPRVLLLATTTGYQIRAFGEAATQLGIDLVFASDRCDQLEDPWWDRAIPVRFHQVETSTDTIVRRLGPMPLDGLVAVGDRPTPLAARVAAALGLPGHPVGAAEASRNKLTTRALLRKAGLPTPWFETIPLAQDPRARADTWPYPVVLKPLALSGSRGVMRADDRDTFLAAFERLRLIMRSPDVRAERDQAHQLALVESFIPGREHAVEALLDRGTLRVLAIIDKPDPLDGPYFEETIYVTPSRAEPGIGRAIEAAISGAVRALGLFHGPVHAECRVQARASGSEPSVHVLEVAARPIGGLCARALRFTRRGATESLEAILLRHAAGEDVSTWQPASQASGVMMIPIPRRGVLRAVHGVSEARAVAGIEDVVITAKTDAALVPLPEARSYLGFIFASAERADRVERALRDAHARLAFTIDRDVGIVR